MDSSVLIYVILAVFAIAVVILGLRYRTQIMSEIEDVFDGDDEYEDTAPRQRAEPSASPASEPETGAAPIPAPPISTVPKPSAGVPPSEPPVPAWDVDSPDSGSVSRGPTRGGELAPQPVAEEPKSIVPEAVKFSAYYPRETAPQAWQPLAAYVYKQSAAPDVMKDVKEVLGARMSEFRRNEESARVSVTEGAMITATPNLPGFQVNPPSLTIGYYEAFHRFDFKIRATSAVLEQAANGVITFTIEGVIVADLPISIFVGQMVGEVMTGAVSKPAYQAIFCSYSHDDTQIVERVEKAYKALGLTYLRDVEALKSGQNWNAELLRLIEQADIFQLFWSQTAAESKYVRQEWEHAIQVNRQIRPVYLEKPIPKVPDALRTLHFAYMPELAE
jgi:hypothetical protein